MSRTVSEAILEGVSSSGAKDAGHSARGSVLDRYLGPSAERATVLIVDGRALYRECLAKALVARRVNWKAVAVASVEEWRKSAQREPAPEVVLLCAGTDKTIDVQQQLALLQQFDRPPPVALLCEQEGLEQVTVTRDHAVRGYIPSNATLDVVVRALDFVRLGGVFIPANGAVAPREMHMQSGILNLDGGILTAREYAVLASLRQGQSNKRIAYDLKMSESTVKVHVRNIMKKLKARNRTEVAFLTQSMFGAPSDRDSVQSPGADVGDKQARSD
jgi:DNA-binding NarL/FixJ family response regulator